MNQSFFLGFIGPMRTRVSSLLSSGTSTFKPCNPAGAPAGGSQAPVARFNGCSCVARVGPAAAVTVPVLRFCRNISTVMLLRKRILVTVTRIQVIHGRPAGTRNYPGTRAATVEPCRSHRDGPQWAGDPTGFHTDVSAHGARVRIGQWTFPRQE